MTVDADIVIVGAGIAGLAFACALAETDLRIILLDDQPPPEPELKNPYDLRVSAINHASRSIFESFNTWGSMQNLRMSFYNTMHVWDANSPTRINFDSAEVGQRCLGYIIEHSVIKHTLWRHLIGKESVRIHHSVNPQTLVLADKYATLQLSNGEFLHSSLLVGADGGNSWIAAQAQLRIDTSPYHQSALVTTIRTAYTHQNIARQRFLTRGPLAFLPLSDPYHSSIVWSTTPEEAAFLQEMEEVAFNKMLTQAIEYELGDVQVLDQRVTFPLVRRHAAQYVKPRVALIGDAAHILHPLAGQGINLGLLDAACLAEVLQKAIHARRDLGDMSTLRCYERWRKGENTLMIAAMEGFKQLFGNHSSLYKQSRYVGFALAKNLPFMKTYLIERAMGLRGDLPKRAR
jgi:2-polyprenylphenol 6-hydroxylase